MCLRHTAPTEAGTLSLHDALPIYGPATLVWRRRVGDQGHGGKVAARPAQADQEGAARHDPVVGAERDEEDRKSTRLNSSHVSISYAAFCLKKKDISFSA